MRNKKGWRAVIRVELLGHVRMYNSLATIWRGFQKLVPLSADQSVEWDSGGVCLHLANLVASYSVVGFCGLSETLACDATCSHACHSVADLPFFWPCWYRSWRILLAPCAIYLFQPIALHGMFTTLAASHALERPACLIWFLTRFRGILCSGCGPT